MSDREFMPEGPQSCPWTDAVIARHLDGDVGEPVGAQAGGDGSPLGIPAFDEAAALADHLLDCPVCQRQLQRSRRLDALLAESAGRQSPALTDEFSEHVASLIDGAVAAATAPANPPQPPVHAAAGQRRRPLALRLASALALVAAGFGAAALLLQDRGDRQAAAPDRQTDVARAADSAHTPDAPPPADRTNGTTGTAGPKTAAPRVVFLGVPVYDRGPDGHPVGDRTVAPRSPAAPAFPAPRSARLPVNDRPTPVSPAITVAPDLSTAPRTVDDARRLADLMSDRSLTDRLHLRAALLRGAWAGDGWAGSPWGPDRGTGWRPGAGAADRNGPDRPSTASLAAAARAEAIELRCRSSALLLQAAVSPADSALALRHWTHAVAGLEAGAVLDRVLDDARDRPQLAGRLRARLRSMRSGRQIWSRDRTATELDLDELADLTAAARLGGRELDSAVRQVLCRADVHAELAAALRIDCDRPGRAALLLDVWSDRVARGADDDEQLARTLFTNQSSSTAVQLVDELRRARGTPRRMRCLLALGAQGGGAARPALLAALHGPSLPEAHAAAFALGMLPRHQLADLVEAAESGPQAWLLRAALCCAGLPRALAWTESLDLTPAERDLLAAGRFTFNQFPVFANMLRERGAATF